MHPRFALIPLACGVLWNVSAQHPAVSVDDQCAALPTARLMERAVAASTHTNMTSALSVWPGGDAVMVQVRSSSAAPLGFCARVLDDGTAVRVVSILPGAGAQAGTTALTLDLPAIRFGIQQPRRIALVGFPLDSAGQLVLATPTVSAVQLARLSNGLFAGLGAFLAVGLAYGLAVLSLGRVGTKYSFNPVFLTSGTMGRASLSQLQIFGFTLLVLGLLFYVLLRTGVLSDISEDVLLLLGIAAAGTAGSKVAGVMKRRLSFDNWSWLRNQGWLLVYEVGTGQSPDPKRARWADLLKMGGSFDVYSFQLATVSLLVGGALLGGVRDLATFSIPPNVLALLGLSNVVYIGGKAVEPNSFGELDVKVKSVRDTLQAWLEKAAAAIAAVQDAAGKLAGGRAAAPAEYEAYLATAREAARMMKSLYGAEGTKFKQEPIADAELAPVLSV